jgi:hypothetical protein
LPRVTLAVAPLALLPLPPPEDDELAQPDMAAARPTPMVRAPKPALLVLILGMLRFSMVCLLSRRPRLAAADSRTVRNQPGAE